MSLSAHEKLTGARHKPIVSYWAEASGRMKQFPFGTSLRKARLLAKETAEEWDCVVRLLCRSGYGKAKYVDGQSLYYPIDDEKYSYCPKCFRKGVYWVAGRYQDDSLLCKYCQWSIYSPPDTDEKAQFEKYLRVQDECERIVIKRGIQV